MKILLLIAIVILVILVVLVIRRSTQSNSVANSLSKQSITIEEMYFSRAACWSRLDDHLVVHDSASPCAPRMITMEPWHEAVFMAADGQNTVAQFVINMASQYEDGQPANLREQVHEILSTLLDERILRLHDHPEPLPPYFAEAFYEKDPETRKQQMQADGLID